MIHCAECTSQRHKCTAGVRVMIIVHAWLAPRGAHGFDVAPGPSSICMQTDFRAPLLAPFHPSHVRRGQTTCRGPLESESVLLVVWLGRGPNIRYQFNYIRADFLETDDPSIQSRVCPTDSPSNPCPTLLRRTAAILLIVCVPLSLDGAPYDVRLIRE